MPLARPGRAKGRFGELALWSHPTTSYQHSPRIAASNPTFRSRTWDSGKRVRETNAMEGGWNRQPTGAPARAKDVVVLASTIDGVLAFGDHRLLIRLAGPSDTAPSEVGYRQALGHLRAQGLAEEVVVEETVRPGNLVTQAMVAAMRSRYRRGEIQLSDLAAAILYRQVDRTPTQHRAGSQPKTDSGVLKRVLLAQMRCGEAPVAAIEQATLEEVVFKGERPEAVSAAMVLWPSVKQELSRS